MLTRRLTIIAAGFCGLFASCAYANTPPATPTITEPAVDGRVLNPEDVHMETSPFSDADPGDTHLCTDWEIWTVSPSARVWSALCVTGLDRVHIHLGDGAFEGSHAGRTSLLPSTSYRLRARHRDDSGDPATEWSLWAGRLFDTGAGSQIFPLLVDDVDGSPLPAWTDGSGAAIDLPDGAGPAGLTLESAAGQLLLEFRGADGAGNAVTNPAGLGEHVAVRVRIDGGASGVVLPESDLHFSHDAEDHGIYLPAISLAAGEQAYFWVSISGSSYFGDASQAQPDFSSLARGAPVPWTVAQPGYRVEVVATGFQLPVNIAFIPNASSEPDAPYFYVTELYGTIRVVRRNGGVGTFASGLINFNPTGDFPGSGEQGLTGICVDPATGDVFAAMLYDAAPPNGPHYPKVVRYTSTDGGQTMATATTILDMVGETQGQSHQISNLSIGPDGKLYVHMGDGFSASTALNLDSFRGKILRLNLDGSAPSDNPFYNATNGINARDYVFAYGFRNPFGGAWRASDQMHYEVENGPSVDRMAQVRRGVSYGWTGSDASMQINAIYNWNPAHAPVNIAFVQPATFGGSGFPAEKQDHAFVTESGPTWATGPQTLGKRITEFTLDTAGNVIAGPRDLVVYNGEGKATAVGLAAGPDGLYFTDLYKDVGYSTPIDPGANVLRIRYVGTADFTADEPVGPGPRIVTFTDTSTAQSPSAWHWDFGDGATSTLRNPTHTYTADGTYDVRLSVTTPGGLLVAHKPALVRVRPMPSVTIIGGSIPPTTADASVATYLATLGYDVQSFDDEPANRPSAGELAEQFDCVVVSSTIASGNIGGQFRTAAAPLVFWEQALLRTDREALADDAVVTSATTINIVNNVHPITLGLPTGLRTVFTAASNMSLGRGNFGAGAQILATRGGGSEAAIIAADRGAALLGGYVAPERRVFVFFEDASFLSATADARALFRRSIDWAVDDPLPGCIADLDGDREVDLSDLSGLLANFGSTAAVLAEGDVDNDGDVDISDLAMLLARFGGVCP